MTLEDFAREKGVKLVPWQTRAAAAFILAIPGGRGSGKTFLVDFLSEFVEKHGDSLEVATDPNLQLRKHHPDYLYLMQASTK